MAILAECPRCHKRQAIKNKICTCGDDLDKEKRRKKVRFWIVYRLPNGGKQRWEPVGLSIEEAKDAMGKRRAQKVENPGILEKASADKWTFVKLSEWYLDLDQIKKLKSFDRVKGALKNFNQVFGARMVSTLKPLDLEDYQEQREEEGLAAATIDMEVLYARAMVNKAFDNDKVGGRTLKAFRCIKKKLRRGDNARKRTLTIDEYLKLVEVAPAHLKAFLTVAFNTGMRLGEIRALQWAHIDRQKWVIRLPAELTKEKRAKVIPINHHVKRVLAELFRIRAIGHDFVLTYQNAPIVSHNGLKNSFEKACGKAGIPHGRKTPNGITFHDTRGTVKTNMLSAGVDKVYRDTILGHSLRGMDVHYMSPSEDDLHRAMAKYTEWFDGQTANVSETVSKQIGTS